MGHILTPCDSLQETPLGKADCSWFTDGSSLKNEYGKYCADDAIVTPFEMLKAASFPLATSGQQATLYALTPVCI